ncbi:MAG: PIG-L family deacetylase [Acidimicrobiales bacterium]
MATLVCFHAHPDDESIATGGTMALAADAGHEVVLVVATRGEHGEAQPGVLADGEELWRRRVEETYASAEILGVSRVEFLGYRDSGMMGEPTNDDPRCFWRADLEEAADRLAAILEEVGADVLTIYDDHGGYGHPDHIQVHRVGRLAAERVGVRHVFQVTMNRDQIRELMSEASEELEAALDDEPRDRVGADEFGSPATLITHAVDVRRVLSRKRASMEAHRSQIGPETFFLKMPPEAFAHAFGTEWYIELGRVRAAGEPFATDLFAGVG